MLLISLILAAVVVLFLIIAGLAYAVTRSGGTNPEPPRANLSSDRLSSTQPLRPVTFDNHAEDTLNTQTNNPFRDPRDAERALSQARIQGAGGVQTMLAILRNEPERKLRDDTIKALVRVGSPAVPSLIDALTDHQPDVRVAVATALGDIGDTAAVPALIRSASYEDNRMVRWRAVEALAKIANPASARVLIKALEDDLYSIREAAADGLGNMGQREAEMPLIKALDDSQFAVREAAVKALVKIGVTAPEAVSPLTRLLREGSAANRFQVVLALGNIGEPAHNAVPGITAELQDPDKDLREASAWALGNIGERYAVPSLRQALLGDDSPSVREAAAWALGNIGDAAAVPDLEKALNDHAPTSRARLTVGDVAAESLQKIGTRAAMDALAFRRRSGEGRRVTGTHRAVGRREKTVLERLPFQPYASPAPPSSPENPVTPVPESPPANPTEQDVPDLELLPFQPDWMNTTDSIKVVKQNDTSPLDKLVKSSRTVRASVFAPRLVERREWQSLVTYIYRDWVAEQVEADARQSGVVMVEDHRRKTQVSLRRADSASLIIARPKLAGFEFDPPQAVSSFNQDLRRLNFKFRAVDAVSGQNLNGSVMFSVDGLVIADVPFNVRVSEYNVGQPELVESKQTAYNAVFCSYSRQDKQIITRLKRASKALNMDFLGHVLAIQEKQRWSPDLLELIEQAQVFQLFWSGAAAESRYVEKEWRHALSLNRDASSFIRPVYWSEPLVTVPQELRQLDFIYQPELMTGQ